MAASASYFMKIDGGDSFPSATIHSIERCTMQEIHMALEALRFGGAMVYPLVAARGPGRGGHARQGVRLLAVRAPSAATARTR